LHPFGRGCLQPALDPIAVHLRERKVAHHSADAVEQRPPPGLGRGVVFVVEGGRIMPPIDGIRDRSGPSARGNCRHRRVRLLSPHRGVIGGLEFRRGGIAIDRQFHPRISSPPEPVSLPSEMILPVLDVLHRDFDSHDTLVFLVRAAGSLTGALSKGLILVSLVSSFLITSVIFAVLGSTSTLAISRPLALAALMARATSRWRKLLGARWRAGLFGGSPIGGPRSGCVRLGMGSSDAPSQRWVVQVPARRYQRRVGAHSSI